MFISVGSELYKWREYTISIISISKLISRTSMLCLFSSRICVVRGRFSIRPFYIGILVIVEYQWTQGKQVGMISFHHAFYSIVLWNHETDRICDTNIQSLSLSRSLSLALAHTLHYIQKDIQNLINTRKRIDEEMKIRKC